MNKYGWCPVLSTQELQTKCTEGDCAWWDGSECVVFSIKKRLDDVTSDGSYDINDIISAIDS